MFHGQEVEGMRKKNFKRREKRKIDKCAEVYRTYDATKKQSLMTAYKVNAPIL